MHDSTLSRRLPRCRQPFLPRVRRALQAGVVLVAGSLLMAAPAVSAPAASAPAVSATAPPLTIAVARLPYSLGFFVADAKKYFTQEGLVVRLVDCFPGRKCLGMMLEGKAQMATVADSPIVVTSFQRADFSVLATVAKSSSDVQIVARKSAGIARPGQLVGKRIGVAKGTSSDYYLHSYLLYNGIDPATVVRVNVDAGSLASAMARHEVDAVSAFEPSVAQAKALLPGDTVQMPNPKIYTVTFNLVAARNFIGAGDDQIMRLLRALQRAREFIEANPAAARQLMQEKLQLDAATVETIFPTMEFQLGLDQSFIKTLESQARWYVRQPDAVGRKPANYLNFVYPGPLSRVDPAAITLLK